jgi:hypothetical protein
VTIKRVDCTSLGRYLTYYYKAWFKAIIVGVRRFFRKVEPFNDETFEQFGDVFKF